MRFVYLITIAVSFAAAAAGETGSRACERCHQAIYRRYMITGMARSAGAPDSAHPVESFSQSRFQAGVYEYGIARTDSALRLEMRGAGPDAPAVVRTLKYFVGSGSAARSYLLESSGFLYEAPAAWYRASGAWGLAPGYAQYSYPYLARAIVPGCLSCHASGIRSVANTQNAYASPPFDEGGVSCERCHGNGEAHVRSGRRADISNPARLKTDARDAVCEQCHLTGDVRVGGAVFVRAGSDGRRVTGHVENLAQSMCMRSSNGKLWCGSCHDPHGDPAPPDRAGSYRGKCLSCHSLSACTERREVRARAADNCLECHMPKTGVRDADHVVFTDHSIPRRPRAVPAQTNAPDAELLSFANRPVTLRERALAYAIVAAREQRMADADRALELLRQAAVEYPNDAEVLACLADLDRKRGDDKNAEALFRRAIRLEPAQASAPAALGAYALERGDAADAVRLWTEALRISPALPLVRLNLAAVLIREKRTAEAREVLDKALEFSPWLPGAVRMRRELR